MNTIRNLDTEKRNPKTLNLDQQSISEFLSIMNEEDQGVPTAVQKVLPKIEETVQCVVKAINIGGRLVYIGAGTSGRLGVLDAVECPPTFGTTDEVIGIIAGGEKAFLKAVEGAEDNQDFAKADLENIHLQANDFVVGIAASGRTPYVIAGLKYAKAIGCKTAAISCSLNSPIGHEADIAIEVNVGPEVLTGSTRLKAGTAQKLILNMISTASMIQLGKTYSNLMIDVQATNKKLVQRAKNIVVDATGVDEKTAAETLIKSQGDTKIAILSLLLGIEGEEAKALIEQNHGSVYRILQLKEEK